MAKSRFTAFSERCKCNKMRQETQVLATQLLQEISIGISSGCSESKSTLIRVMRWINPGDPAYNTSLTHLLMEMWAISGIFMNPDL